MLIKHSASKVIRKATAVGSMLTLVAGMTSCSNVASEKNKDDGSIKVDETKYSNGDRKPNVVYIILDDIGFSDLGCYGSEIKTPNIDKLASDGLRYNNFNTCPLSSPTRASLLTGRENNSVGMGNVADVSLGPDRPDVQASVTPKAGTVAEILQNKGFNTYALGKWHLAPTDTITQAGPFDYWPLSKGFDKFYGYLDGDTDQFNPSLVNGNELIEKPNVKDYNLNDDLLQHAKSYIASQVSVYPDQPFFMNYAFGTAHAPLQAPQKYLDMYNGVYDAGWDKIREERFEREKEIGIIPQDAKLTKDSTIKSWDSLSVDEQKIYAKFMQSYAGYITQADDEVGKLVDYLKEIGQYDNTMFVLIGDNGATKKGGSDGSDSHIRAIAGKEETSQDLSSEYNDIGTADMHAAYPTGWANVSNTPFQNYKSSVYQGALRNPLIITWPNGIKDKGGIRSQYVHVTDITPTVLDELKITPPKVLKGIEQMPMYGTSIASTFDSADAPEVRTRAITYIQSHGAIYDKGWKAIFNHKDGTSFDDDKWELYHVSEDYSESTDVASQYPDKLKELKEAFMSEAKKTNILPLKESGTPYIREDAAENREVFRYYPGVYHISEKASPIVSKNSFTITAPVTRNSSNDSGVIVAMGDEMGGYTLYIKDNKLVFEYNTFDQVSKITSNIDVPTGKSELKFDFKRTSINDGTGTLYINGQDVGEGDVKTSTEYSIDGLDIGRDTLSPVSKDYKDLGEFPFTGTLDYVQFNITKFKKDSEN